MTEPASNVYELPVPPKTVQRNFKRYMYVLTYVPENKEWSWEVHQTMTIVHKGLADTQRKAESAAKRKIQEITQYE